MASLQHVVETLQSVITLVLARELSLESAVVVSGSLCARVLVVLANSTLDASWSTLEKLNVQIQQMGEQLAYDFFSHLLNYLHGSAMPMPLYRLVKTYLSHLKQKHLDKRKSRQPIAITISSESFKKAEESIASTAPTTLQFTASSPHGKGRRRRNAH